MCVAKDTQKALKAFQEGRSIKYATEFINYHENSCVTEFLEIIPQSPKAAKQWQQELLELLKHGLSYSPTGFRVNMTM
jgi:hypothetical protein